MANENKEPQTGKKSNFGTTMLIVTMVILCAGIIGFVAFDNWKKTSSVRNTPLTSANRLPLLNPNSAINSASISANSGYGGKFNY